MDGIGGGAGKSPHVQGLRGGYPTDSAGPTGDVGVAPSGVGGGSWQRVRSRYLGRFGNTIQ